MKKGFVMNDITLHHLIKEVRQFCEARNWGPRHNPKDLAIGLSTEASEVLELFRFRYEEEMKKDLGNPAFLEELGDELCDSLYFILRLADVAQIDLKSAFERKMKKNADKYPAP